MTSDLEPKSPEVREELLLDNVDQMLETCRAQLEFAASACVIDGLKDFQAFSYPRNGRFDGTACRERRQQFRYRMAYLSVGIRR